MPKSYVRLEVPHESHGSIIGGANANAHCDLRFGFVANAEAQPRLIVYAWMKFDEDMKAVLSATARKKRYANAKCWPCQ